MPPFNCYTECTEISKKSTTMSRRRKDSKLQRREKNKELKRQARRKADIDSDLLTDSDRKGLNFPKKAENGLNFPKKAENGLNFPKKSENGLNFSKKSENGFNFPKKSEKGLNFPKKSEIAANCMPIPAKHFTVSDAKLCTDSDAGFVLILMPIVLLILLQKVTLSIV